MEQRCVHLSLAPFQIGCLHLHASAQYLSFVCINIIIIPVTCRRQCLVCINISPPVDPVVHVDLVATVNIFDLHDIIDSAEHVGVDLVGLVDLAGSVYFINLANLINKVVLRINLAS